MTESSKKYYPRYGYLLLNVVVTALFLGGAYYFFPLLLTYDGKLDLMGLMIIAVCLIVPIIVNVSTIPQYRVYGVDSHYFYINGKNYDWKQVRLAGVETLEKRLKFAYFLTVASSVEENLSIEIFDDGSSQILRHIKINNKICKEYNDLEKEIREHIKKE